MITKERIDTHNLQEIDRLIYRGDYTIDEICDQLDVIFFTADSDGKMFYLNAACASWLNRERSNIGNKRVSFSQYLEVSAPRKLDQKHAGKDSAINYHLHKVWFPAYLDYRLCLITNLSMTGSDLVLYSMMPLQDWEHLNRRLLDLVKEEDFINGHQHYYELLTKREKEVVQHISDGYTTLEISEILSISRHTVEQHRKNIKRKLKAKTIAKIVRYGRIFSR